MESVEITKDRRELDRLMHRAFPLKEVISYEEYLQIKHKIFNGEFENAEKMIDEIIKDRSIDYEEIKKVHYLKLLNECKKDFTRQEFRTFRGQMIAGDVDGALKGMDRLMRKKGKV